MKNITVIAPANTMHDLSKVLRIHGEEQLKSMSFNVAYGAHVDDRFLHMAGSVENRVLDLETALKNPNIEGVMAVYGGYNTNQLLPLIQYESIQKNIAHNKFIMGYSDITALLLTLNKYTHLNCYHGPGFASFCDPSFFEYTRIHFLQALSEKSFSVSDPGFFAEDAWYIKKNYVPREIINQYSWKTYQSGTVTAPILGGNLDTLCALAGTPYFPDLKGKVLFIEDAVGNPGVFHRNMTQLNHMSVFNQIEGLIIGKFPSSSLLDKDESLFLLLNDILRGKNFPVLCHVHCSHVDPMITISLGKNACLLATEKDPHIILNAQC